jgi:hypothetical protein
MIRDVRFNYAILSLVESLINNKQTNKKQENNFSSSNEHTNCMLQHHRALRVIINTTQSIFPRAPRFAIALESENYARGKFGSQVDRYAVAEKLERANDPEKGVL